jgi:hypothetical protein
MTGSCLQGTPENDKTAEQDIREVRQGDRQRVYEIEVPVQRILGPSMDFNPLALMNR